MNRKELAHELLSLRNHAQNMNEHAVINFWTADHDEHDNYHVNQMHDSFKEMAVLLGYEITRT